MPINRVNAEISPSQAEAIRAALAALRENLPFLIDLTPDERQGMLKFGEKNRSFVAKAMAVAEQNPDILPRGFNVDEMKADVRLVEDLYPLLHSVQEVLGKLENTYFAAGSEAYAAALLVYQYAKAANVATGALEDALDDLGRRFARRSKSAGSAGNGGVSAV
ncbi:hypothetical protein SAMN02949497_3954 [Methylomagnum ishizawai]|uniref:Uncharacterized protein n=1 Tax=Methylomagnum ishizawai TaxID=1760988 RepID=A0A1Y6D6W5_9GAMM|nr:hypothetical protein [Methylomagnum ishizawai]SMF96553.1 hypothetical protein SAMN02949497_3954 [Methylomagnum ishizawai]